MSTVMRIGLELGFKMYYNFSRPPKGPFSPHHNIIITPLTWNSEQHQQALTCQPCRLTGVCKPVFQTQLLDHTSPGSPARWAAKRRSASLADNNSLLRDGGRKGFLGLTRYFASIGDSFLALLHRIHPWKTRCQVSMLVRWGTRH